MANIWESEYNGTRAQFNKDDIEVYCEIKTGWTATIDEWKRTIYPAEILDYGVEASVAYAKSISGITFQIKNGDDPATNVMVSNYDMYWTWFDASQGIDVTAESWTTSSQTVDNSVLKRCFDANITAGTPITLFVRTNPLPDQYFQNHLLQPSLLTSATYYTLTRLGVPQTAAFSDITPSSFKITWGAVDSAVTYETRLYKNNEPQTSVTVNEGVLFQTFTGLTHDERYEVRFVSKADNINFADSEESIPIPEENKWFVTLASLIPLEPPTNIVLQGRTSSSLTFTWDPPASVEGLTGYTVVVVLDVLGEEVEIRRYTTLPNQRNITINGLTEDVEYKIKFQSNGDKINYDDSDYAVVTETPKADALRVYNNEYDSDNWTDDQYSLPSWGLRSKTDNTNVYTTLLTGWTANVINDSTKRALTRPSLSLTSVDYHTITIGFSTVETDWSGNYRITINAGDYYGASSFIVNTTVPKSRTSFTFQNMDSGQTYTVSITQIVTGGDYFSWGVPTTYTFSTKKNAKQPTTLVVTENTITGLTFEWYGDEYGIGQYDVYFTSGTTVTTSSPKITVNSPTAHFTGLSGGTNYSIGIVVKGNGDFIGDSDMYTETVKTNDLIKLNIENFAVIPSSITANDMAITWNLTQGQSAVTFDFYFTTASTRPSTVYTSTTLTTVELSNLVANTYYYSWVQAKGDKTYYDDSEFSYLSEKTNEKTPLETPSLSATTIEPTRIVISWTAIEGNQGYLLYTGDSQTAFYEPGSADTSYTFTNLTPDTPYKFRLVAKGNDISTCNSAEGVLETRTAKLTKLLVSLSGTPDIFAVQLNWETQNSPITNIVLYTGYTTGGVESMVSAATVTPTLTQYNLTGLQKDTNYYIGIKLIGDYITTDDSDLVYIQVKTNDLTKLIVTSFSLDPKSFSVKGTWTTQNSPIASIRVFTGTTRDNLTDVGVSLAGSATEYNFTGLQKNTTYWFGVKLIGDNITTQDSDIVSNSATTLNQSYLEVSISQTNSTDSSATVRWTLEPSGAVAQHYDIYTGSSTTVYSSTTSTQLTVTLNFGSSIVIRVIARGDGEQYLDSSEASVTAKANRLIDDERPSSPYKFKLTGFTATYSTITAKGGTVYPSNAKGTYCYPMLKVDYNDNVLQDGIYSTYGPYTITTFSAVTYTTDSSWGVNGSVYAGSRGTTNDTNERKIAVVYGVVSSYNAVSTNGVQVNQEHNIVESYTDYQNPTGAIFVADVVPASGTGNNYPSIRLSNPSQVAQTAKPVYTSTATGNTYVSVNPGTISSGVTNNQTVPSKNAVTSETTTAFTANCYYICNGKTGTTSCYVTQEANYDLGAYYTSLTMTIDSSKVPVIPASGGTIAGLPTNNGSYSVVANGYEKYTSNYTGRQISKVFDLEDARNGLVTTWKFRKYATSTWSNVPYTIDSLGTATTTTFTTLGELSGTVSWQSSETSGNLSDGKSVTRVQAINKVESSVPNGLTINYEDDPATTYIPAYGGTVYSAEPKSASLSLYETYTSTAHATRYASVLDDSNFSISWKPTNGVSAEPKPAQESQANQLSTSLTGTPLYRYIDSNGIQQTFTGSPKTVEVWQDANYKGDVFTMTGLTAQIGSIAEIPAGGGRVTTSTMPTATAHGYYTYTSLAKEYAYSALTTSQFSVSYSGTGAGGYASGVSASTMGTISATSHTEVGELWMTATKNSYTAPPSSGVVYQAKNQITGYTLVTNFSYTTTTSIPASGGSISVTGWTRENWDSKATSHTKTDTVKFVFSQQANSGYRTYGQFNNNISANTVNIQSLEYSVRPSGESEVTISVDSTKKHASVSSVPSPVSRKFREQKNEVTSRTLYNTWEDVAGHGVYEINGNGGSINVSITSAYIERKYTSTATGTTEFLGNDLISLNKNNVTLSASTSAWPTGEISATWQNTPQYWTVTAARNTGSTRNCWLNVNYEDDGVNLKGSSLKISQPKTTIVDQNYRITGVTISASPITQSLTEGYQWNFTTNEYVTVYFNPMRASGKKVKIVADFSSPNFSRNNVELSNSITLGYTTTQKLYFKATSVPLGGGGSWAESGESVSVTFNLISDDSSLQLIPSGTATYTISKTVP